MKKIFFIIAIAIVAESVHPQGLAKVDDSIECVFLTQGYIFESISGKGFSNSTGSHISNVSSSNPATMHQFETISFGLSYQAESAIEPAWIADINHERDNGYLPQSLGFVIPLKRIRIGFGFSQRYNSMLDLGAIEKTTMEHPEGTGEFFKLTKLNTVISYSSLLSYAFKNVIKANDQFSIGIQYNYNLLAVEERLYFSSLDTEMENSGWTYGLAYRLSDRFQLGAFYETKASFQGQAHYEGTDLLPQIDLDPSVSGNNQEINPAFTEEYTMIGRPPDKLHVGFLYKLNASFHLTFDLTHVYWSQLSEHTTDNDDITLGVTGELNRHVSLSLGLLSSDRRYDDELNNLYSMNGKLNGTLFLAGLNLRIWHVDLDVAYVTDAFKSGEWRKQNIGKLSLGFYL